MPPVPQLVPDPKGPPLMTITSTSPAIPRQAPARAGGRSRPARGEGQWALGYREPLNKNEENKKNDDGLHVRQRIIDIYSKRGFDSIDPADLRGRFRWFGLYTQRKPGISGGKTATLEPEELDDRYFMLRVRIDGGQLDYDQLTTIADISRRYARGTADVTDRQNIQLHWIQIEDVPAIWEALEAVGLSTMEACGDTPRVILGCPLAGIDATEIIDATPQIRRTHYRYIGNPEFSNLPRKFKSAISGCPVQCTLHEINDIAFAGVTGPDGTPGYDLWVGGGLSTNPMIGKRLGAFVRPDQVDAVWAGVTGIFRDYGYRRLRHRARIKFLIADWGPERFREVLERDYLGFRLADGPAPEPTAGRSRDHVGIHPQKDGRLLRRLRAHRGPAERRFAGPDREAGRPVRQRAGADHHRAENGDPRRARRADRRAGQRAGRGRPAGDPQRVPAADHGLHRHRVLQARHRGDQAPCRGPDQRAGAAAA